MASESTTRCVYSIRNANSKMCGPILQVGLDEESDQTGDSGKGTGSGTTQREEWIRNPPPGVCIALHTLVYFGGWIFCCIETREHHYQSILTDSTKKGMCV